MSQICVSNSTSLFKTIRIISVISIGVCAIFIGILGVSSIEKFQALNKLHASFKYTFHLSWIFSLISLLFWLITIILCWCNVQTVAGGILIILGTLCFEIVLAILLLVLLLRLHFTFKGSYLELSTVAKIIFSILYVIILIMTCVLSVIMSHRIFLYWFSTLKYIDNMTFAIVIGIHSFTYIGTTVIANIIFGKKLINLSNVTSSSSIDIHQKSDILNKEQLKIIESVTRHSLLLNIGIFGGFITVCFIIIAVLLHTSGGYWTITYLHVVFIIISIDFVVHVSTIYLQYSFTTKYYDKYCKTGHSCWRYVLTQKAEKLLLKQYQKDINHEIETVHLKTNEAQRSPLTIRT
eukprot:27644_1